MKLYEPKVKSNQDVDFYFLNVTDIVEKKSMLHDLKYVFRDTLNVSCCQVDNVVNPRF